MRRVVPRLVPLWAALASVCLLCGSVSLAQGQAEDEEPALPPGLEEEEPALPAGLGEDEPTLPTGLGEEEPALPTGLGEAKTAQEKPKSQGEGFKLPFRWTAFFDMRAGLRVQEDPVERRTSLGELRVQLHGERSFDALSSTLSVTGDLLFDPVLDQYDLDIEEGTGLLDLRELSYVATPLPWLDVKLGRQILTWGTGDLLFINDLFPKDWNAFLIGRDIEYLKAPSDALKLSAFHSLANLDLVLTPRFDPDRFPDRRRLSSYSPLDQSIVGRATPLQVDSRDDWIDENELAGRLYRRLGRIELAAYAYRGYWKSPGGFDGASGEAIFPPLSVYGASARRPLLGGIAHVEGGYYDSRSDRSGDDPLVRNSEVRGLLGFEKEAATQLTLGMQYYAEYMRFHQALVRGLPPGTRRPDQIRHLVTLRARYLALKERLELGLFAYASPNEKDIALMPEIRYTINDQYKLSTGANLFAGTEEDTFFGQLEQNSNVYASLRGSW